METKRGGSMSEIKQVVCTACNGTGESGHDDMGTQVVCESCGGEGKRTIIIRRDPVLWREYVDS